MAEIATDEMFEIDQRLLSDKSLAVSCRIGSGKRTLLSVLVIERENIAELFIVVGMSPAAQRIAVP